MHVQNRLPCRCSIVHADIVAIWLITLFEPLLALLDQLHDRFLFSRGKVKPVGGMAIGDDQQMASRNRKAIQADMSQRIGPCSDTSLTAQNGHFRFLRNLGIFASF